MQSSSSFSSSRSGRPRPANLTGVSGGLSRPSSADVGGSESLWASPSFNVKGAAIISPPQTGRKEVFADPGRPSSSFTNGDQASYFKFRAPVSSLPPTPQTASNQLPPEFSGKDSDLIANDKKSMVSVGGDKLSPRLPSSNDGSLGSGSTLPRLSEMLASAALASPTIGSSSEHYLEPLSINSAPPRLVRSASGRFEGPRASWTHGLQSNDPPISVGVNFAPRMRTNELPDVPKDAYMRTPQPENMIPSSWNPSSSSSPSCSSVTGLGLQLDATPRASDCMGPRREYSFRIPGASPSAPSLQAIEQGVFPTFPAALSSPSLENPSATHWNTDLRFDNGGAKEYPMDREVREPATELEIRQIEVMEGEMPRGGAGGGLVGLGIYMDGKLPERRARNQDASSSSSVDVYGEDERASAAHTMASLALMGIHSPPNAASTAAPTSASSSRPTPKRPQSHIDLKPHVHKMRLGSGASVPKSKKTSTSEESGRDKGKRRSEALVRQVNSSSTSISSEKISQVQNKSPTVSPKKRALELEPEMEAGDGEDEDGDEMALPIEEIEVKVPGSVAMLRENQVSLSGSTNDKASKSSNLARHSSPGSASYRSPFGVLKLGKKTKSRSTNPKSSLRAQAQVQSSALQSSFQLPSQTLSSEPQAWSPLVPGSMTSKAEKEKRASIKKQKRAASEGSKGKERSELRINVKNFDAPLTNSAPSSAAPRKALGIKNHNVSTPRLDTLGSTNKGHLTSSSEGSRSLGRGLTSNDNPSNSPSFHSSNRTSSPSHFR